MTITTNTQYPDHLADEVEDTFDTADAFDAPQDETIEPMEVLTEE